MEEINKDCPCKRVKCERHGRCDACREHHGKPDAKYLTACERINKRKKKRL
ncbi:hypothetical protein [Extibacter muris]|uniref:hypothetical protein n=1 Tax=Extibacter muris TaxID=1796622 RepID=UPI001D080D42|nr:hypothetical protein [Extibacter muris]MCB6202041.1 hypothetical protein [Extibacter muris]MCQ4663287.1 hypothetical protein [Extibacter muris]MCQ4692673.1 hypothetical protein [Extibacter muris]